MDIKIINRMLKEGKTVKEVRESLGIPEKKFQKTIKDLGYKYNQSKRLYINVLDNGIDIGDNNIPTTTESTTMATTVDIMPKNNNTTLTTTQTTTIDYLTENIDLLKQLLENYKRTTEVKGGDIVINLVDDKHLSPKPKSIRINEFVWRDWLEYTKNMTHPKGDLVSQALKEFMDNHEIK